jgi:hypothetical protein
VPAPGDDAREMPPPWLPDDETIEAIVAGDEVDARFDRVADFARQVRALGDGPPPPPSPALEAAFAGGLTRRRRQEVPRRRGRLTTTAAKVAGLGVVAKIGLGTSVAAAGVVAAGAGGVLPDPATREVRAGIEAVTPFDFGPPDPTQPPGDPSGPDATPAPTPASRDTTGESRDAPTTERNRSDDRDNGIRRHSAAGDSDSGNGGNSNGIGNGGNGGSGANSGEANGQRGNGRSPTAADHQPPGHDDDPASPGNSDHTRQPGNSGNSGNPRTANPSEPEG